MGNGHPAGLRSAAPVPRTGLEAKSGGDPVGQDPRAARRRALEACRGGGGMKWDAKGERPPGRRQRPPTGLTNGQEFDPGSGSRPISRVLSRATIHLGRASPRASSDLPGSLREPRVRTRWSARFPIWSCSRWGLPCRRMLPPTRCALTAPFHPCRRRIAAALGRFAFCCTFRGLAPPRNYLAPCSVEPGLSSAKNRSGCLADSRAQYTGRARLRARASLRARAPGRRVPCGADP